MRRRQGKPAEDAQLDYEPVQGCRALDVLSCNLHAEAGERCVVRKQWLAMGDLGCAGIRKWAPVLHSSKCSVFHSISSGMASSKCKWHFNECDVAHDLRAGPVPAADH